MTALLETRGLTKRFGHKEALSDVSLRVNAGAITGLLGPNGSGKTTLIKLACGLLTPTAGEILIDGVKPSPETKAKVAYLPERPAISDWMRVGQAVAFYSDFYANFSVEKAYSMLEDLKIDADVRIKTLSKGNREKVQLILTMSREASLYLLDEPLGGVDPAAREYILNTIIAGYREEAAVIISTHLIADVENVLDDVIFIREGVLQMHESVDNIREEKHQSVDELFREVFRS